MSYIPTKHAFGFFDEFKAFMFKGNLIDMAVGIIIGGAFGNLVSSLVKNVIMPFVGAMTAVIPVPDAAPPANPPAAVAPADPAAAPAPAPAAAPAAPPQVGDIFKRWSKDINGVNIPYGSFISDLINFLILGLVIFIVIVKFVGWITKQKKEDVAAPPPPPADVALLTEIRDLLKARAT